LKYYKLGALIVGGLIVLLLAIFLVKNLFSDSTPEQQPVKPAIEQVQKPVQNDNEQLPQTEQKEEAQTEAPDVREVPATPSNSQETTSGTSNEVFDVMGSARQAKRKLEAEERARQQKAKKQKEQQQKEQQQKEQQKQQQKEQQKQEDGKQPSDGNNSKREYKPEMI
jgi:type IV secretory pathway VirB10-like protein